MFFLFFFIVSYLCFYVTGYSSSRIYGKHLWMGMTSSQLSDARFQTFLDVCSCMKSYDINFAQTSSRDHCY